MISDGWNRMNPRSSQRCAPCRCARDVDHDEQDHAHHPHQQRETAQECGLHLRQRAPSRRPPSAARMVPSMTRFQFWPEALVQHDQAESVMPHPTHTGPSSFNAPRMSPRGAERAAAARSDLDGFVHRHYSSPCASGWSTSPVGATTGEESRAWWSCRAELCRDRRAIARPRLPCLPFSMSTATASFGASAGAKATNSRDRAGVRRVSSRRTFRSAPREDLRRALLPAICIPRPAGCAYRAHIHDLDHAVDGDLPFSGDATSMFLE